MFADWNKHTEPEAQEAQWEGWTPPWMHEGPGPRGPFGPGRGFGGPRGGWGPWGGGPRHWHGPHGHFGPGHHQGIPDELLALRSEAAEVARLFAIAGRGAFENKERVSQLHALLERTRQELSEMIYGSSQSQTGTGESASGSSDVGQA